MESAGVCWFSHFVSISNKSKEGRGRLWAHSKEGQGFPGVESVCVHVTERQRVPSGICHESLLEKQGVALLPLATQPHLGSNGIQCDRERESPS